MLNSNILEKIESASLLILAGQNSPDFSPALEQLDKDLIELAKDKRNLHLIHEIYWALKPLWQKAAYSSENDRVFQS